MKLPSGPDDFHSTLQALFLYRPCQHICFRGTLSTFLLVFFSFCDSFYCFVFTAVVVTIVVDVVVVIVVIAGLALGNSIFCHNFHLCKFQMTEIYFTYPQS